MGNSIAQVLQADVADVEGANGRAHLNLKLDAGCGGGGREWQRMRRAAALVVGGIMP